MSVCLSELLSYQLEALVWNFVRCNITTWRYVYCPIFMFSKKCRNVGCWTKGFFQLSWSHAFSAPLLQRFAGLLWNLMGVTGILLLPYWNVHIVRKLCLGKNCGSGGCLNLGILQQNWTDACQTLYIRGSYSYSAQFLCG